MAEGDTPHLPCPFEDCGSSDAFNWNDDGYGYCHSCGSSYPSREPTFDWAAEQYPIKRRVNIMDVPIKSMTYEGIRGIKPEVCQLYQIQLQLGEGGEPIRYAYKYPHTTKYRSYDDKKKTWQKDVGAGMAHLFGPEFNSGTSQRLYLTEGEFDAASLYEILGQKFPVKSLPSAAISNKFLQHNLDYLNSFPMVIYAGELDAAGRSAADKLYSVIPEKFFYVSMTKHKDANDFLTAGDGEELMWAARKPQKYSPDNFFISDEDVDVAIRTENPYSYVPTGHSGIDDKIRGLVKGGLTFIKAPRGTGKTEVIRYFENGLLRTPDTRIALLHMEEMKSTTYRAMATYHLGCNVRTNLDAENNNIGIDQVVEAAQIAADTENNRTIIFEMRGHDDPLKLLDHTRTAATVFGADYIFVDHVQRLAYLSSTGVDGATSTLTTLGSRMAQLAKELDIGVIFISQVNDDGRTKYAASLEEEAIICLKIDRDVESEDEIIQNTTNFMVDKNRPFAKLGYAGSLYYDPITTILTEDAPYRQKGDMAA
jgi:KaiC/GvpD/RAD55 family RecA-like ATPase